MPNTLLTSSKITKESLSVLHNTLGFVKGVNREYSNQFAATGGKIGNTINVRQPNKYVVQQGPSITPQGTTESTTPLTLNRQWVIPMSFSSAELTLSIEEFSKRYIQPAMAKMSSTMDLDCARAAITGAYMDGVSSPGAGPVNTTIGTPGTTPGTSGGSAAGLLQYNAPQIYLNAGLILDNNAAPRDRMRTACLNPGAQAQSVGALAGLFNPQGIISDQYKNGLMGNALGFDFTMDQNMPTFTTSTGVSLGTVTLTFGAGIATATAVTSGGIFKAGTTFTVAGCYAVNPENQQSTGLLQQFVVTADNTATTTTVSGLSISPTPKLVGSTVADGNCFMAAPAATIVGAAVITSGTTANTAYPISLAYHKDAFTLGTADMELPGGVDFASREQFDGISMRLIRQYDINTDLIVCRIDVLGGFANLRPEMATRIAG
jgi:hypothetical protein